MKKVHSKSEVETIFRGKKKTWENRDDAIDFFADGVLNSEGTEQERCLKVLVDLTLGKNICKDK